MDAQDTYYAGTNKWLGRSSKRWFIVASSLCCRKAALETFTYAIVVDACGTGVNVNTVYPPANVDTGFFRDKPANQCHDLHTVIIFDEPTALLVGGLPARLGGIRLDRWVRSDDRDYYLRRMREPEAA